MSDYVLFEAWECQLVIDSSERKNLHLESERLKTFSNWNVFFLDKRELAMLGFYFVTPPYTVQCVFCGLRVKYWEPGDDVLIQHFKFSPSCPLLGLKAEKNLPIDPEKLDIALLSVLFEKCNYCGSTTQRREKINNNWEAQSLNLRSSSCSNALVFESEVSEEEAWEEASEPVSCKYPQYEMDDARFDTFKGWSKSFKKNPEDLCDAGFFYSGNNDEVKCYSCGGTVMGWQEKDSIWEVHASRFNNCEYVKFIKGDKFVEDIKASQNAGASGVSSSSATTSTALPPQNQAKTATAPARNLLGEKTCKICYEHDYNTVFIPCGHVMACSSCASSIKDCPLCRKPITAVTKLFFC